MLQCHRTLCLTPALSTLSPSVVSASLVALNINYMLMTPRVLSLFLFLAHACMCWLNISTGMSNNFFLISACLRWTLIFLFHSLLSLPNLFYLQSSISVEGIPKSAFAQDSNQSISISMSWKQSPSPAFPIITTWSRPCRDYWPPCPQ